MKYTQEQRRAIETTGKHLCVDAGAGSGKTRVLVDRMVYLLDQGHASLDGIVAITFTEKAAAEMRARLRRECRKQARAEDKAAADRWRAIEQRIDAARITTIHSFCASLLREHAIVLGLDPDFAMLDEAASVLLRDTIVTRTVHALLDTGNEHALELAAEFGVRALSRTMRSLLRRHHLARRTAELTPLDNADLLQETWEREIEEFQRSRIERLRESTRFAELLAELEAASGHCIKEPDYRETLRKDFLRHGERLMAAKDPGEMIAAARGFLAKYPSTNTRKDRWSSEQVYRRMKPVQEELRELIGSCFVECGDPETERRAAGFACAAWAVYSEVDAAYALAKRQRAAMDFDDLIAGALEMLESHPEIRESAAAGIEHLLIDEFQDTDHTQLEIARLLAREDARPGAELFIVGDAKQSIYNFRGAEVEVFRKAAQNADETIPLAVNFRSAPDTLSFVNAFFRDSGLIEADGVAFQELTAHRDAAGECRVEFLIAGAEDGEEKKQNAGDRRRAEADLIARRIAAMCAPDSPDRVADPETGAMRPVRYGDIAMLFKASSSVYLYEDALRDRGIPFHVDAGRGFFRRQEISDLRNLIGAVIDPWDEVAIAGFLRSPIAGLADAALMEMCEGRSLGEAFRRGVEIRDPVQRGRLAGARALFEKLRPFAGLQPAQFLRKVLAESAVEAILFGQAHGAERVANVRKLVQLAEGLGQSAGLREFIGHVDDVVAQDIEEGDAHAADLDAGVVSILTVHKSKGLEFPVVIIADTSRKPNASGSAEFVRVHRAIGWAAKIEDDEGARKKPGIWSAMELLDADENAGQRARELYVAMTRARDWLLISGSTPEPGSWLESFDRAFRVAGMKHGETFSGAGWTARVVREISSRDSAKTETPAPAPVDIDSIRRRVAPFVPSARKDRVSVSQLLGEPAWDVAAMAPVSKPAQGAVPARIRGEAVHRMFELWDFVSPPPIDRVLDEGPYSLIERTALETRLIEAASRFKNARLCARLKRERDVQREVPFMLRLGARWLHGTIDLLLEDGTIVDYKTGARDAALEERYARQVMLYAAAVRAIRGEVPPAGMLYYVDSGEEISIAVNETSIGEAARAAEALLRAMAG